MRTILEALRQLPEYQALVRKALRRNSRLVLEDTPSTALAALAAALREDLAAPILFLVRSLREAETELRRIHGFLGAGETTPPEQLGLFLLPSYHLALYEGTTPEPQLVADRLRALSALAAGEPVILVGTPDGALQPTVSPQALESTSRTLSPHQQVYRQDLLETLQRFFYQRVPTVERPGEFSVRGSIVDLFPPPSPLPARIEFLGDEIESIREFDPGDQLSRRELSQVTFGLASEVGPLLPPPGDEAGPARFVASDVATALDHLPHGTMIIVSDPLTLEVEYAAFHAELLDELRGAAPGRRASFEPPPADLDWNRLLRPGHRVVSLGIPPGGSSATPYSTVSLRGSSLHSYANQIDLLCKDMAHYLEKGGHLYVASKYPQRVQQLLSERELPGDWEVFDSPIQGGLLLGKGALVFLTDKEIFGWERVLRPLSAFKGAPSRPIFSIFDLRPDDLVVHINHGIGHFGGVITKSVQGITNDYILINYADGDRLFVPVTHLWRVQKYVGGEAAKPTIHRLRSVAWKTSQSRAKQHAEQLAGELLQLQARRRLALRPPFSADSPWMEQLEASFPYEETADQVTAIEQVKSDMESPRPMDRLVCGEVGFGKTEVAIRAAFKAVLDGKQVALLAPTTVLAQQHFATFSERLGPQAVTLAMLSRFQSPREQKAILEGLKRGSIDVVIGTHRLLQKDVQFKNSGLLIVDEEQRFGVRQKEKLKKLKESLDILTLTATPIPRTLHLAISGLRDMSLVNEPPVGRLAVETHVVDESDGIIRDAILRELERGGQVFFVHNRVENISHIFHRLASVVPSARIRMAHGQMAEAELEPVVIDFLSHKFDVLLCTTIIENGLDIPNANTLIVRDADKLGLAQMYQLRGRVGRSNRQAYAYFLYRQPKRLSRLSLDRLRAIGEMSELGAGFRLALRDLEIRGAGNILGEEQHGHIEAVGFELYCQLLEDAVREVRGQPPTLRRDLPSLDLPLDIRLPPSYIPEETDRLEFYRRFAAARGLSEVDSLAREMTDRFGPPPETAANLIEVVRLRSLCLAKAVAKITLSDGIALLEADPTFCPGPQGRLRLRIREKNGKIILEKLKGALSTLPDVR